MLCLYLSVPQLEDEMKCSRGTVWCCDEKSGGAISTWLGEEVEAEWNEVEKCVAGETRSASGVIGRGRHSSTGSLASQRTSLWGKRIMGAWERLPHNFSQEHPSHDRKVTDTQYVGLLVTLSIERAIHSGDMDPLTVLSRGHMAACGWHFVSDNDAWVAFDRKGRNHITTWYHTTRTGSGRLNVWDGFYLFFCFPFRPTHGRKKKRHLTFSLWGERED